MNEIERSISHQVAQMGYTAIFLTPDQVPATPPADRCTRQVGEYAVRGVINDSNATFTIHSFNLPGQ